MNKKIIFENEFVESLIIQWKRNKDFNTYKRICGESIHLIDSIIRGSKFSLQVPFLDLRNWLFLQFERWIEKWVPGDGKIYTYMSFCIKNGCMSYVSKEKLMRQRCIYTDVPLESLSESVSYESNFGFDLNDRMRDQLSGIVIRWHEPHVREAIKYMMYSILRNRGYSRRKQILKTACEAYSMDVDTAKFMLDWTHGAVRNAFLEHYNHPLSFRDLLVVSTRFTFIGDLIKVIGFDNTKKLCCVFAGNSIKFPSASQLVKLAKVAAISNEAYSKGIDEVDVAKRFNMDGEQLYSLLDAIMGSGSGIFDERPLYESRTEIPIFN
jgi:hypothetical protein